MKLASQIIGGIVIAMFIVIICFTFVGSKSVFNSGEEILQENAGGSIGEALTGGLALLLVFFGAFAFIFMIFLGVILCLFLLSFILHYIKRLKAFDPPKYTISYNTRLVIISVILSIFAVAMFAMRPSEMWKAFTLIICLTVSCITYAILSNAEQKRGLYDTPAVENEDDFGGEYPKLDYINNPYQNGYDDEEDERDE